MSQNGPNEGSDLGVLESRKLRFDKVEDESVLRLTYSDVFRVRQKKDQPPNQACRWTVKIGDDLCKDAPLVTDRYDGKSSDVHSAGMISGYCKSVPAGSYDVSVEVMPRPHETAYKDPDCYTGWNQSTWSIEVIEYRNVY